MKIVIADNYFRKTLHHRCLSGFWICIGFWIYKGFECASGSKYADVVNIPGFWKKKGSEYARIVQDCEYAWKVLKYGQICLNISEYPGICVNMPKSTWMAFILYFLSVIICLVEDLVTYFKLCIHETRRNNFLKKQFWFFLLALRI